MVRRRLRLSMPYAARSSKRVHCLAAGGDGVTALHVDGGLRAVLSGAVLAAARLRRWENQHNHAV